MNVGFIGLGEAAGAIISGWKGAHHVRAYDRKLDDSATAREILERGNSLGVTVCATGAETVEVADLVFSTVTADQAVAVAEAHGAALKAGAIWCDLNSCAPKSKEVAAHVLRATGGRYLDVAVMAPVYPKCNMVPCLISGPEAEDWAPILASLPMDVRVVGDTIGRASSIKMVRSIMVKGLEALTAECVLAAAAADVADEVFPSLKTGHPKIDVEARANYNFERTLVHGVRRAAEMDEVAKMLSDLGLPDGMSAAAADWQRVLSGTDLALPEGDTPDHRWFAAEYLRRFLS